MKHVLITGASSGIGLHLAKAYLNAHWRVIACGRSESKLRAALDTSHPNLQLCIFEQNERDEIIACANGLGRLDMVILNAGTCEYIDLHNGFDSALFERVMRTNAIGTANCLEAFLPYLEAGSQLAIVSSTVTLLPLNRAEAYGASKAALDYLSQTLAIDLAQRDIDVSLIRPGFVDTPLTAKNTFPMPGMISAEQACRHIMRGLQQRKAEINFPRGFYFSLKGLALLPTAWWRRCAINMIGAAS